MLCISTLQFITGLILLGIYEGFRAHAVKDSKAEDDASRLACEACQASEALQRNI